MPQASTISVLVVDDQLTMRALIRNALQQIGFKDIREAPDGEEALKNLLAKPANLVISDFNMPKMDGLACCARCARTRRSARPPSSC
jgi:two-component system chemotaxis response regulator CheY